jgi:hypothetical protein
VSFFPISTAKEQINKLSQSGTRTIKLVDRTFNCNAERAYEIFEYVINLECFEKCRLFHFEVGADLFDERTLALLSTAPRGRIQLEAGLQSFHNPALKASSRYADTEKAVSNIKAILRVGNIHVHVDLIAGLPHETLPDFQNSFDKAYSIGAHTLQLGFLKLLHGSALREQAARLGIVYSENPPYEFVSSPWLSSQDVEILKQAENALQHTHNKKRFLTAIKYALEASGLRPFEFFRGLGSAVNAHGIARAHGVDLGDYAERVYNHCVNLPNVGEEKLHDCMTCDWLAMVRGNNTPAFLKKPDNKITKTAAEKQLGRKIIRYEVARLHSGEIVFVDSNDCDPVTGLYRVRRM